MKFRLVIELAGYYKYLFDQQEFANGENVTLSLLDFLPDFLHACMPACLPACWLSDRLKHLVIFLCFLSKQNSKPKK